MPLVAAVRAAEATAPTRPHPGVETATANLLLGPPAAIMDRARDLIRGAKRKKAAPATEPSTAGAGGALPATGTGVSQAEIVEYIDCCTVRRVVTYETREHALARCGRALADPTRCRILLALLDGPRLPGQARRAKLGLTRSNVSNHLSCLRGCGLVVATYEGRQVRYDLADPHLGAALRELLAVVLVAEPGAECAPEDVPTSGRELTIA